MNLGKLRLWAFFLLFNLIAFGLLGLAYLNGWVEMVVERDVSRISLLIFALFLLGIVMSYFRVRTLNRAFDDLAAGRGKKLKRYQQIAAISSSSATEALKTILGRKLMWISSLLFVLPALGLLGTVIGITIGFETSVIANAGEISEVVEELFFQILSGLSVAFYTTIVGMVLMLWTYVNYRMLEVESMRLMELILEAAHDDTLRKNSASNKGT